MPTQFAAQRKHAEHFARIAKELATAWKKDPAHEAQVLQKFDREQPQLDKAWATVLISADLPDIDRLRIAMAEAAEPFLDFRYQPRDLLARFELGVIAAERVAQTATVMRLHGHLGHVHRLIGDIDIALELHQAQLAYAQSHDDHALSRRALLHLAHDYLAQGNYAQAHTLFTQVRELSRGVSNRLSERAAISGLGTCALRQKRVHEASTWFEHALQISRELGDRRGEAQDLGNLGIAMYQAHKLKQALIYLQQHLSVIQEQGNKRSEAIALGNVGIVLSALGKWSDALDYHGRSLAIFGELDDTISLSRQFYNIAGLLGAQGQFVEALAMMDRSVSIKRHTGALDLAADQAGLDRMRSWLAKDGHSWQLWMWKWLWNGRAFYYRIRFGWHRIEDLEP